MAHLTPTQRAHIVDSYRGGRNPRWIARKAGVALSTVYRILEEHNIPVVRATVARDAAIRTAHAAGAGVTTLSREYELSRQRIYTILKGKGA